MWLCSVLGLGRILVLFASMFVVLQKNNSIDVLFTVCAADHYYVKIVDKFQSEIRMPSVCKSNSNFKIEVRKFELGFTSLIIIVGCGSLSNLLLTLCCAVTLCYCSLFMLMTHQPETSSRNQCCKLDARFWHVCHAIRQHINIFCQCRFLALNRTLLSSVPEIVWRNFSDWLTDLFTILHFAFLFYAFAGD